jgi:hypothetical protein
MAILAFAISGAVAAILVTARMNTRAEAEMLATAAAEQVLAQVRQTPFATLFSDYVNPGDDDKRFFTVADLQAPVAGVRHGEVILILDESPDEAAYGRNLGVPGGGSGVDLNGNGATTDVLNGADFQVDIDGDGAFNTDAVAEANLRLIPVVVLIRWGSGEGVERLQVNTLVVDRRQ